MINLPLRLSTSTMTVSTTAAAYARSCTSSCGALSWKNTLNGSVATCCDNEVGMLSEKPAVNYPITNFTTKAIPASVVSHVPGPSSQVRTSAPAAGGGNCPTIENADYIRSTD